MNTNRNIRSIFSCFISIYLLWPGLITHSFAQRTDTINDFIILENIPPPPLPKNAVFIELGGNGGLFSLNFDRLLLRKNRVNLSGRIGVSAFPQGPGFDYTFILEPNFYYSLNSKHHLETGFGTSWFNALSYDEQTEKWSRNQEYIFMPRLGYRFQDILNDGFFFRAGFTPIIKRIYIGEPPNDYNGNGFIFWGGLGFGYSF